MPHRFLYLLLLPGILGTDSAFAQVPTQDEKRDAQRMLSAYATEQSQTLAKQFGLDPEYATYCVVELHLHTADAEPGTIPYGVDYINGIPSIEFLDTVVQTRMKYEKAFLTLCLSGVPKSDD